MKNHSDPRPAAKAILRVTAPELEAEFYNAAAVLAEEKQPKIKNSARQQPGRTNKKK